MSTLDREAIEKFEELVQAIQDPKVPEADPRKPAPFLVIPKDWKVALPEIASFPARVVQALTLQDAASFGGYVQGFATPTTAVFLDEPNKKFVAVLDYHDVPRDDVKAGDQARWCNHVASYTAETTPEWDTWHGHNKKLFGQVEFAEFLEDNLPDVAEPSGASLLEITRTLEAKKDVTYSSLVRLNNGSVRLNYDEVIKGTANTQAGVIEIPEQFVLQLQVIKGGSAFRFPARFKYRLKDRAMCIWYEIVRPHKVLEQALLEAVALIQDTTGVTIRKGVVTLPK